MLLFSFALQQYLVTIQYCCRSAVRAATFFHAGLFLAFFLIVPASTVLCQVVRATLLPFPLECPQDWIFGAFHFISNMESTLQQGLTASSSLFDF